MRKGFAPILIILLIAAAVGGYLVYSGKVNLNQGEVYCAEEAKICPDGSSVGRVGPKCEFSPCPTSSDETVNWKTYTGTGTNGISEFSIKYPSDWLLEGNILYPFGKDDLAYKVVLGAGGRGGPEGQQIKAYPGGTAKYYWNKNEFAAGGYASFINDNKNSYIFEITVPTEKESEYQKIFNQILSTFRFD